MGCGGAWDAITLGRLRGFLGLPAFVALPIVVPVFLVAAVVCDPTGGWLDRSKLDQ
jgi:hypothetical protein